MAISFKGLSSSNILNNSQVFRSTSSFTVPSGITSVHVKMRGGNGTPAGFSGSTTPNTGASGGTTTVLGISAEGGPGGSSGLAGSSNASFVGHDYAPGHDPVVIEFYYTVTPSQSIPVTIGAGGGAYAVISWSS